MDMHNLICGRRVTHRAHQITTFLWKSTIPPKHAYTTKVT